jgi:hypothetical protein
VLKPRKPTSTPQEPQISYCLVFTIEKKAVKLYGNTNNKNEIE